MFFSDMMTDTVTLIKQDGTPKKEGIKASIQEELIYIFNSDIVIEPGDLLERTASNRTLTRYKVIDPGFKEAFGNDIPAHYQISYKNLCSGVEKKDKLEPEVSNQEIVHQTFNTYISGDVQNVATGSSDFEQNATKYSSSPEVFSQLLEAIRPIEGATSYLEVQSSIKEMEAHYGMPSFNEQYQSFMSTLSNHITVLGPLVAPFIPALSQLLV